MEDVTKMEDVIKMEGYDENSYHKGFEEGHEVGFQEGVKRGQILVLGKEPVAWMDINGHVVSSEYKEKGNQFSVQDEPFSTYTIPLYKE